MIRAITFAILAAGLAAGCDGGLIGLDLCRDEGVIREITEGSGFMIADPVRGMIAMPRLTVSVAGAKESERLHDRFICAARVEISGRRDALVRAVDLGNWGPNGDFMEGEILLGFASAGGTAENPRELAATLLAAFRDMGDGAGRQEEISSAIEYSVREHTDRGPELLAWTWEIESMSRWVQD